MYLEWRDCRNWTLNLSKCPAKVFWIYCEKHQQTLETVPKVRISSRGVREAIRQWLTQRQKTRSRTVRGTEGTLACPRIAAAITVAHLVTAGGRNFARGPLHWQERHACPHRFQGLRPKLWKVRNTLPCWPSLCTILKSCNILSNFCRNDLQLANRILNRKHVTHVEVAIHERIDASGELSPSCCNCIHLKIDSIARVPVQYFNCYVFNVRVQAAPDTSTITALSAIWRRTIWPKWLWGSVHDQPPSHTRAQSYHI